MKYEYYDGREASTSGKPTIKCSECGSMKFSAKLTKANKIEDRKFVCIPCYDKDVNGELV